MARYHPEALRLKGLSGNPWSGLSIPHIAGLNNDTGCVAIIKELTSTNHELVGQIIRLKDVISKLREETNKPEATQLGNITNLKNQWDKCLDLHVHTHHDLASSTSIPPVKFLNVAPLKVPVITAM